MVVSNQLKKQIVIEVLALIFLVGVTIYAIFAINKSNDNKILSQDGMVLVLDDTKYKGLESYSDGEGLGIDGTTYTVTNNNSDSIEYKLVIVPDVHTDDVLSQIRISVDDLYIDDLTNLERLNGGYVVATNKLDAGYTKIHLIKAWYKLDTKKEIKKEINFEYRVVKVEK